VIATARRGRWNRPTWVVISVERPRFWTQVGPNLDPSCLGGTCKSLKDGGRYRIRTYDFHRVKVALYR
jgi:hypothetical protein